MPVRPFTMSLPADALAPSMVRSALTTWLQDLRCSTARIQDVVLVASEAVSNVVDHAYAPPRSGRVDVRVEWRPADPPEGGSDATGHLVLTVRDAGSWRPVPADPGYRGRGLQLIRCLSENLEIAATPAGTTLTVSLAATRVRHATDSPVMTPEGSQQSPAQ
jgi:anti-sigma regulatory factor (Ser/Thr protein kinase)